MKKQIEYLGNDYFVDENGNVYNKRGKILKQHLSNSGYKCVSIKIKGKQAGRFIHRALAFAFIEQVEGKNYVNHKDGNKQNNELSNLEWCSFSENIQHMYDSGLKKYRPLHYKGKFGSEHNRSKKVICVTDNNKEFGSMSEAQRYYKLGSGSVSWSVKNKKPIYGMHFEIGS